MFTLLINAMFLLKILFNLILLRNILFDFLNQKIIMTFYHQIFLSKQYDDIKRYEKLSLTISFTSANITLALPPCEIPQLSNQWRRLVDPFSHYLAQEPGV